MRPIDADALKDRFKLRINWLKKDVHSQYSLGLFHGAEYDAELVDEIPTITVDAEPVVHGRWERMVGMMPPEYHGRHECSCCGVKALDWKFHEKLSNYCPHCGAKMDRGKE